MLKWTLDGPKQCEGFLVGQRSRMLLPVDFFFFIKEGKDIFPDVGEKYLQLQVQLKRCF